jgi:hypothetical protein
VNRFQDARPAKNAQRDGDAMGMLDLFAWLVLLILAASTIAVVIIMAMLPGMIAKERKHPWAQAVTVAGWVTLLFGFVLWPVALVWAYVDVRNRRPAKSPDDRRPVQRISPSLFVLAAEESYRSTCSGRSRPHSRSSCRCSACLFRWLGCAAGSSARGTQFGGIVPDVAGEVLNAASAGQYAAEGARRACCFASIPCRSPRS